MPMLNVRFVFGYLVACLLALNLPYTLRACLDVSIKMWGCILKDGYFPCAKKGWMLDGNTRLTGAINAIEFKQF